MSNANSKITWTDASWNPLRGCSRVSEGCRNCYAEMMAGRFSGPGLSYEGLARKTSKGYRWTGVVRLIEDDLETPLTWTQPKMIFVNSMSDLFHESVSIETIQRIVDVMRRAHWHTFQVLTKRADRLAELSKQINFPANVWVGVSVESAEHLDRVDRLREVDAAVRWISAEPLISALPNMNLDGISWVVTGGESGHAARLIDPEWVRDIIRQCRAAGVFFHHKQMGQTWAKAHGATGKGRSHGQHTDDIPADLRVREYPDDVVADDLEPVPATPARVILSATLMPREPLPQVSDRDRVLASLIATRDALRASLTTIEAEIVALQAPPVAEPEPIPESPQEVDTSTVDVYDCRPLWCLVPREYRHDDRILAAILRRYLAPSGRRVVLTDGGDYSFDLHGSWADRTDEWFGNVPASNEEGVCTRIGYYSDPFLYGLDEGGTLIPNEREPAFRAAVEHVIASRRFRPATNDELHKVIEEEHSELHYLREIGHFPELEAA